VSNIKCTALKGVCVVEVEGDLRSVDGINGLLIMKGDDTEYCGGD
jgi:hypothetical protein